MSFIYTAKVNIMAVILTKAENFTDRYNTAHKEEKMCNLHKILERRICELFVCYVPQKWLKNSREIYVPNLWHFKQELPAIVFEKCHRILGWQSFQNSLEFSPVSSGTQRQTCGAWRVRAVASNRETMRGIWICQSQVPAFFSKHKLFIYEFIDFSLSSCIFLFIY